MLEYLRLHNVGPAPDLELNFAPRINVITGDNGLGKSFFLDIAWWVLTRTWSGSPARPNPGAKNASIAFRFEGRAKANEYESSFDRKGQAWTGKTGRPASPGLVLYAQVDGGFSVWDPARNYWRKKGSIETPDRPKAYMFTAAQLWDGLQVESNTLCNGLIRDWTSWQKEDGDSYQQLTAALAKLSASADETLQPGSPTRISLDDVRDIPTLRMPYGQDVPVLHASAGMKRIIGLAYLLVWAWYEHRQASALLAQNVTRQVIFLVDEVESHLHPRWQRVILGSLLDVMAALTGAGQTQVQIVTATHSPLILASLEPTFSSQDDAWFDLDLVREKNRSRVQLTRREWVRHGDATSWLTSEAFDLPSARSREAEELLQKASLALADDRFDKKAARALDAKLRKVLGDTDPFWMRWRFVGERRGWLP